MTDREKLDRLDELMIAWKAGGLRSSLDPDVFSHEEAERLASELYDLLLWKEEVLGIQLSVDERKALRFVTEGDVSL